MARIIDENFEPTGYEESWTETVTAGNTLDADAAIPGTPPTGSGSQCLKSVLTAGAGNAYAEQTKTNQNISYIRAYQYLSEEGINNGQFLNLLKLLTTADVVVCQINISQNGGVLQTRFAYYSSGAYQFSSWVNMNLNSWYRYEYKYDLTNMLWEWKLDGVSQASGALTAATLTPAKMRIGGTHNGSAQSTLYTDLVVWDDATWPGAESAGGLSIPIAMHYYNHCIGSGV